MNQNRRDKVFPVQIEEKLQMFREGTYVILKEREQTDLKEKKQGGEVNITYTAQGNTLILLSPENHVLSYLDGQKKGATACADIFLFKLLCESGKWELHIIEFKNLFRPVWKWSIFYLNSFTHALSHALTAIP